MRLDLYLSINNICESRNKASALITAGNVRVNGRCITKASHSVDDNDVIEIQSDEKIYVARSATKLLTAKKVFNLDFTDKTAVDLGASTGGFCEVMLENGIQRVYAVDIGNNQLHPKIRSDYRIVNREKTNARYLCATDFDDAIDIVTCDLSFISVRLVLNSVYCILRDGGEFVCLVKPQFEVGKDKINKNGVVKNPDHHIQAVKNVADCAFGLGFDVCDVAFSGLEGESGNKEYLLYMRKSDAHENITLEKIIKTVKGDLQ